MVHKMKRNMWNSCLLMTLISLFYDQQQMFQELSGPCSLEQVRSIFIYIYALNLILLDLCANYKANLRNHEWILFIFQKSSKPIKGEREQKNWEREKGRKGKGLTPIHWIKLNYTNFACVLFRATLLEKVCEYLYFHEKYKDSPNPPEFSVPPEMALELLVVADYLDSMTQVQFLPFFNLIFTKSLTPFFQHNIFVLNLFLDNVYIYLYIYMYIYFILFLFYFFLNPYFEQY